LTPIREKRRRRKKRRRRTRKMTMMEARVQLPTPCEMIMTRMMKKMKTMMKVMRMKMLLVWQGMVG